MSQLLDALNIAKQVRGLVDDLHTSGEEREELALKREAIKLKVAELNQVLVMAQFDLAKTEAQHSSWFVAGSRPAGRWIGYGGVGVGIILPYLVNAIGMLISAPFSYQWVPMEYLSLEYVAALAGLGGFESVTRTTEKMKGVARTRIK